MARVCKITGKRPMVGNNVSHANNRNKRRWKPNLISKRIWVPELNRWVRIKMSVRALRTVEKKGLMQTLKDNGLSLKDVV